MGSSILAEEKIDPPLQGPEKLIGVYTNDKEANDEIIVTDKGLRFQDDRTRRFVRFSEIKECETPPSKEARYLSLLLKNGENICLRVEGGEGRLRDYTEFVRFIMRVIGDLRKVERATGQ